MIIVHSILWSIFEPNPFFEYGYIRFVEAKIKAFGLCDNILDKLSIDLINIGH